jgi:multicomponent Na+:H+ antiporter subunit E
MLNPIRWVYFLAYLFGPFFVSLAKANFDVAYRVITGKIRPGIVRISPKLTKDLSITMLANSITLTPGTLSVDIDEGTNDLYIHWINVDENALKKKPVDCKYVCGNFPTWIRRIAE